MKPRTAVWVASLVVAASLVAVTVHASAGSPSMDSGPTSGYTIHIDADKHYSAHPSEIVHHWCKKFSDGSLECQLYDGDGPDARLVGAETIVSPSTYHSFSSDEQKLWHYHKVEIPKLHATMPGLSPDEAKAMVASLMETYGKVWILWDPETSKQPVGQPSITILQ